MRRGGVLVLEVDGEADHCYLSGSIFGMSDRTDGMQAIAPRIY